MRQDFVPLTPAIARAFYGKQPARTCRGFALMQGDVPAVIFGVLRDDYRWVLFSEAAPWIQRGTFSTRRIVALGARKMYELLAQIPGPVQAKADEEIEGACTLLERLGFVHVTQGVYQWQPLPPSSPQP